MPVKIKPAPHGANVHRLSTCSLPPADGTELIKKVCSKEIKNIKSEFTIVQYSFEKLCSEDNVWSSDNGTLSISSTISTQLTSTIQDFILTQLNAYINANAEELRHFFVDHEGKKALEMFDLSDIKGTTKFGVDWGKFSFKMSKMIAENIKDSSLRGWILPSFTTTTKSDQAVASTLMMSTMQKYFSYSCCLTCGLPSVTLLGEKEDWEKLELKLERLPTFGEQTAEWYTLLKPVVSRFVKSFNEPDSDETKDFWQRIAHYSSGGSGPTWLSGWITAFCFWNEDGKPFFRPKVWPAPDPSKARSIQASANLELDGARYHSIDSDKVPRGIGSVPVDLNDSGFVTPCIMVAGSMATRISSSGELLHGKDETGLDTLQPESGWFMYEKGIQKTKKDLEKERLEKYKAGLWPSYRPL